MGALLMALVIINASAQPVLAWENEYGNSGDANESVAEDNESTAASIQGSEDPDKAPYPNTTEPLDDKAKLTITANDVTIHVGADPINAGVTYEGFEEGDNESMLNGTLAYGYGDYTNASPSGTYTITPSGLSSNDYEITYKAGTLTVAYDLKASADPSAGGTVNPESTRQVKGNKIDLSKAFELTAKAGYKFKEWKVVEPTTLVITGNTFTMPESDVDLRAVFGKIYTISFDKNEGTGTMDSQDVFQGETASLSVNKFTREHYTFKGWNTKADGTGTAYDDKAPIKPTANMTLYAQWKLITHTISYDANGGTGTVAPQTVNDGESTTLNDNAYTYAQHVFKSWNTKADGTGTTYAVGDSVTPTADMTLFAQWKPLYTITFSPNHGTGTMKSQTEEEGTIAKLSKNTFEFAGHTFKGWNTKADGTGTSYTNEAEVTFNADMELFAQWSRKAPKIPDMSTSTGGNFTSLSDPVTYTITQEVPAGIASMRIWFNLEDVMYYTINQDQIVVKDSNGNNITDVKKTLDGQKLEVVFSNPSAYANKTVQVDFTAKVRDGANLTPYLNSNKSVASIPYQAHTEFTYNDGLSPDPVTVDSKKESVTFRTSTSGSASSTSRTSGGSSTTRSSGTLANTSDPTSLVGIVAMTGAGVAAIVASRSTRRH